MSNHRNPVRPKVPKHPTTDNPPRRLRRPRTAFENWGAEDRRDLLAAYRGLVSANPQAAGAVLDVLQIVALGDRRRSMMLVEAVSTIVSSFRGRS